MDVALALTIGALFGLGVHLLLRRTVLGFVLGLGILSNSINLLIFGAADTTRRDPPLVSPGALTLDSQAADPLPQALVLTAIVITFGISAFALALAVRVASATGVDDADALRESDAPPLDTDPRGGL